MSSVIRVNPASIRTYGASAQGHFTAIRAELESLVRECVDVHYFGPSAVQFKTGAGKMSAEFATQLVTKMGQVADAVRASTSNIAASLGGAPISIQVNGAAIAAPAVASVDYVDVDTSALEALKGTVTARFATITGALDQHLRDLQGTDWVGNAKTQTEGAVGGFTTSAKTSANDALSSLTAYITSQLDAVLAADR
jgi:hypothetical protein